MNKNIKLIGIGAIARVGKDTMADYLLALMKQRGLKGQKFSLATPLKADLQQFLSEKCNMDVWTGDTADKEKFRDLLVAYGKIQRQRTQGIYWTNLLQRRIEAVASDRNFEEPFYAIVADIRYAFYEKDEHHWIKSNGGTLIHLSRADIQPANKDEAENDPKIEKHANILVNWESRGPVDINDLDCYYAAIAKDVLNTISPPKRE